MLGLNLLGSPHDNDKPEAVWPWSYERRPHSTGVAAAVTWHVGQLGFHQWRAAIGAVLTARPWWRSGRRVLRGQHGTDVQPLLRWVLRLQQQTTQH